MQILFLRHIAVEGPALAGDIALNLGLKTNILDVSETTPWPANTDEISHIVVLGGPPSVYERDKYPWLDSEEAFLKKAMEANIPILGICLGAQILAHMLGGTVQPGPDFEIGWAPLELNAAAASDPLLNHLHSALDVFHWHGDRLSPPSESISLAATASTPCQAFRWGERTWGLQFHIEVRQQDIAAWREAYPKESSLLSEDFEDESDFAVMSLNRAATEMLKDFFQIK